MLQLAVIAAVTTMPLSCRRTQLVPCSFLRGVDAWKHVKFQTVHLAPEEYVRVLACGRKISESYQKGGVDVRLT